MLDNGWGDYRNPASEDRIGIEAKHFKYKITDDFNAEYITENNSSWNEIMYFYGQNF